MQILNHLSDLGSNFIAPKNESLNLSMSIGTSFSPIVLSKISEYGNFSIIKARLTTCLKSSFSIKNSAIVLLFLEAFGKHVGLQLRHLMLCEGICD